MTIRNGKEHHGRSGFHGRHSLMVLFWTASLFARAQEPTPAPHSSLPPIPIDFYYEDGCSECERIRQEVLPSLDAACSGFFTLREVSTGIESNYLALVALMKQHNVTRNERVFMLVNHRIFLAGYKEIAERLESSVTEQLLARVQDDSPPPLPAPPEAATRETLAEQVQSFTVAGVAAAGLADGINPCAISTLIFLISVLTMAQSRGIHIARIGIAFCAASFLTYTAIGFGLLRALHALSAFRTVKHIIETGMLLFVVVLSFLSFRDAIRFHNSGKRSDIALQLPDRIKATIHKLLRTGIGMHAQVASAFAIGAAVTALESVCTGQVYVPTLVLVMTSGVNVTQSLCLLLLYNLMFILPLVIILLLTWRGMKVQKLIAWSTRNVAASKTILGFLFLALAGLLLMLR